MISDQSLLLSTIVLNDICTTEEKALNLLLSVTPCGLYVTQKQKFIPIHQLYYYKLVVMCCNDFTTVLTIMMFIAQYDSYHDSKSNC